MKEKFYKVTIGTYSCLSPTKIEYKLGKWTKPEKGYGPLAVFNTLNNARALLPIGRAEIYECEISRSNKTRMWTFVYDNYGRLIKLFSPSLQMLPDGTVLAKKVKLLRRVD